MNAENSEAGRPPAEEPRRLFKISFELSEEARRWAPGGSERLWTEKTDVKLEAVVRNVPFYLRGIAYGDTVRVRPTTTPGSS
jgi:hypothetical protein